MSSVVKSLSRRASKSGVMSSREKANNAAKEASSEGTDAPDDLSQLNKTITRLERFWSDQIRFRL